MSTLDLAIDLASPRPSKHPFGLRSGTLGSGQEHSKTSQNPTSQDVGNYGKTTYFPTGFYALSTGFLRVFYGYGFFYGSPTGKNPVFHPVACSSAKTYRNMTCKSHKRQPVVSQVFWHWVTPPRSAIQKLTCQRRYLSYST